MHWATGKFEEEVTPVMYMLPLESTAIAWPWSTPLPPQKVENSRADPAAFLSITKAATPDPVAVGTNLTYTLTVTNGGPNDAPSVTVTDALPAGVTFVSATPTQGSCAGSSTVTCSLGTILSAGTAAITLMVTPTTAGTLNKIRRR